MQFVFTAWCGFILGFGAKCSIQSFPVNYGLSQKRAIKCCPSCLKLVLLSLRAGNALKSFASYLLIWHPLRKHEPAHKPSAFPRLAPRSRSAAVPTDDLYGSTERTLRLPPVCTHITTGRIVCINKAVFKNTLKAHSHLLNNKY
jgi:hypothetical protein